MKKKLEKARKKLLVKSPFFGQLTTYFEITTTWSIGTITTDYEKIYVNPQFAAIMSIEELEFMIGHEILHCVFDHFSRREARLKNKWDAACDFAVNDILTEANIGKKPAHALYNKKFHNLYAEKIYDLLPDGNFTIIDKHMENFIDQTAMKRAKYMRRIRLFSHSRFPGDGTSSTPRSIDSFFEPRLPWGEILKQLITENVRTDWSWYPPSKRHLQSGFVLPSLRKEKVNIPIGIDTSSSITKEELTAFISEILYIIRGFPSYSLTLIFCDAKVQKTYTVNNIEQMQEVIVEIKGGGGTDFKPVFQWVAENISFPPCLIYLTDLWGKFPSEKPIYPVIWISVGGKKTAPFGSIISLDNETETENIITNLTNK